MALPPIATKIISTHERQLSPFLGYKMKIRKAALLSVLSIYAERAQSFVPVGPDFELTKNGSPIANTCGASAVRFQNPFSRSNSGLQMTATAAQTLMNLDLTNTPAEEIESLVRAEYLAWAQMFGKVPDFERRYPTFSKHFMMQLQFDKENNNGDFAGLNEFGDMTEEEYNETIKLREMTEALDDTQPNDNPVDAKILSEYASWAATHNKQKSMERFSIFKENFLANMKHYQETGDYYVLNEYADMTDKEYDSSVGTASPVLEPPPLAPMPSEAGSSYMSFLGGSNTNDGEKAPVSTPTVGSSNSYLDSMNSEQPVAATPGISSYIDRIGQGDTGTSSSSKQSSYMPQSYKEPTPSANSYLDSMGKTGLMEKSPAPPISYLEPLTPAGPAFLDEPKEGPSYADTIKSQMSTYADAAEYKPAKPTTYLDHSAIISPSISYTPRSVPRSRQSSTPLQSRRGIRSDQAAPMPSVSPDRTLRIMDTAAPITFKPLANPISKPNALSCDQSAMMRENEVFLPRASNPVIKRSCLEPDQSKNFQFFFTGRLCAVDPFTPILGEEMRSPYSDQERIDHEMRRTQLYFQQAKGNALLFPS